MGREDVVRSSHRSLRNEAPGETRKECFQDKSEVSLAVDLNGRVEASLHE